MGEEVENPLFARFFHRYCGRDRGRGERELRRELLAGVSGRVVEVGAGNGINFEHYPAGVNELIAVEPEPYLRSRAERAATDAPVPVRVVPGVAAALGLAQGSVDAVVVCGVLCSVPDQREALSEFRRVLRAGGELRFYEHVRSRRPSFARWQRRVDSVWPRLMGGCHPDRDERCRGFSFPATARIYPVAPRILGVARAG
jgi:SAM-dependent methyltransferase